MSTCAVCGTSTTRRTNAETEALDLALDRIVAEIRPATVRQVFYQAEVRGLIPKCQTHGYRVVQRRLLVLRETKIIPFGWITDNARTVRRRLRYRNLKEYAKDVARRYYLDYWVDAPVQVEVWVEKDALAGVLFPTVDKFGLELYVTRGYSSVTYLQEAAGAIAKDGRPAFVYVLTDFDPSGIAIAENIERELVRRAPSTEVRVERVAVTREQIDLYGLPTRPIKPDDPNRTRFVSEHGIDCVELDSIDPNVLRALVSTRIELHMDQRRLQGLKEQEERERKDLEGIDDLIGGVA